MDFKGFILFTRRLNIQLTLNQALLSEYEPLPLVAQGFGSGEYLILVRCKYYGIRGVIVNTGYKKPTRYARSFSVTTFSHDRTNIQGEHVH